MIWEALEILAWYNGASPVALVLDIAAIAAIVGALATFSRNRQALEASESAGAAWHEERDAALARAERERDLHRDSETLRLAAEARILVLEARPNLIQVESLIEAMRMQQDTLLKALTSAIVEHETNALQRADRLIEAVESLSKHLTPH
jgi:hypothetical protein